MRVINGVRTINGFEAEMVGHTHAGFLAPGVPMADVNAKTEISG